MDRPILFSAPMVRAILAGSKTMTRRIDKPRFDKWQVGDRLWVRETYLESLTGVVCYRADYMIDETAISQGKWRPSTFMPRHLSRITLEITELKRERLQDISEADAEREGCGKYDTGDCNVIPSFTSGFKHVFETINGRGSWKQNPQVVAIGFKVLEVRNGK